MLLRLFERLDCAFGVTHPAPLVAESDQGVAVPTVFFANCQILLRRLEVIGMIARSLGEPSAVETHGEPGDLQILGLIAFNATFTEASIGELALCCTPPWLRSGHPA